MSNDSGRKTVTFVTDSGLDHDDCISANSFTHVNLTSPCLPFNVARAYDEALGLDTPRIWTAERDQAMWEQLQR